MNKFKIIKPQINPITVTDGRGGILTYIPDEPIVEFNILLFKPNKVRGLHYHEYFSEYLVVIHGEGVLFIEDIDTKEKDTIFLSTGIVTKADPGLVHTVHAITDLKIMALLTRKWDDCPRPIVQMGVIP